MSACLVFVFAGLLEYALVNVIARKGELQQQVRFSKEVSYFVLNIQKIFSYSLMFLILLVIINTKLEQFYYNIYFYREVQKDQRNYF